MAKVQQKKKRRKGFALCALISLKIRGGIVGSDCIERGAYPEGLGGKREEEGGKREGGKREGGKRGGGKRGD